jgi:hypothetical protein
MEPNDELTVARQTKKHCDDARALVLATQAHRKRELELLATISELEKDNRRLRTDLALTRSSRPEPLPRGSYREQGAVSGRKLDLPRMASRNRAGSAPPPPRRSGAPPRVQGRSREAS